MPRSPRTRSRRARRERADRLEGLRTGRVVEVPCRARRTTPRGWGAWVDGTLRLPGGGGAATFVVDDPSEVALVTRQGEAPLRLDPPLEVEVRPVRYKAETFYGSSGAEIIVVTSTRRTLEVALPPEEVEPVARRLADPG